MVVMVYSVRIGRHVNERIHVLVNCLLWCTEHLLHVQMLMNYQQKKKLVAIMITL